MISQAEKKQDANSELLMYIYVLRSRAFLKTGVQDDLFDRLLLIIHNEITSQEQ